MVDTGDSGPVEAPPLEPEETPAFAEKAKDLQALRDAVLEASTVSGPLWVSCKR
jgi:hypothetical protein